MRSSALDDAGVREVEYLDLAEGGHGFTRVEDEQAWYDALVSFLAKHDPPG